MSYAITIYAGDREFTQRFKTKEEAIILGVDIWMRMSGTVYEPLMFTSTEDAALEQIDEWGFQLIQAESFTDGSLIVEMKKEKEHAATADD